MVSHASKKGFGSHNERFYEEYEYERKLKKRKARLISAAEEAFTHIKRMQTNQPSMYKIGYLKKNNFTKILLLFFREIDISIVCAKSCDFISLSKLLKYFLLGILKVNQC